MPSKVAEMIVADLVPKKDAAADGGDDFVKGAKMDAARRLVEGISKMEPAKVSEALDNFFELCSTHGYGAEEEDEGGSLMEFGKGERQGS